jgi:hypothetical protein
LLSSLKRKPIIPGPTTIRFSSITSQAVCLRCAAGLVLLAVLLNNSAHAAAWDWGSEFRLTGSYNDNPTLAVNDDPDGTARDIQTTRSLLALAELQIIRAAPSSSIVFEPRVTRSYYPDKELSQLEQTNWYMDARGFWLQRRSSVSLGFRYQDAGILSTEDTFDNETGGSNLRVDDKRQLISLSPNFSWDITQRDQISIGSTWSETDYQLDFTGRADLKYNTATLSYQRSFSERHSLGFLAGAYTNNSEQLQFIFAPTIATNETDGINLSIDYNYSISEDMDLALNFGRQESDSATSGGVIAADLDNATALLGDNCATISENVGADPLPGTGLLLFLYTDCTRTFKSTQYRLNLTKRYERTEFNFGIFQSIVPGSTGVPQERLQLSVRGTHQLTEKVTLTARLLANDQTSIGFDNFTRESRNLRADINSDWLLTPRWAVGALYVYRNRKRVGARADLTEIIADSNEMGFYIRYNWESPEL